MKPFDVTIIGAGILGCFAAHELSKRGIKVLLLDAGSLGEGTSTKSFCWINATSKTNNKSYFELNAEGLASYQAMAEKWGARELGLHQSGMIKWAKASDGPGINAIQTAAQTLADWGYSIRLLDENALQNLEPNVRFDKGSQGYQANNDCWLEVPTFLRFLKREILATGSEIMENCRALELQADDNGKISGLVTEKGPIICSKVIVATGADTPQVLSQLTGFEGFSTRFPVQTAPGLLLYTPPIKPIHIKHVMYLPDANGLHIRPTDDGGLLLGADDTDGMISESQSTETQARAIKILLQRAQEFIPDFAGADLVGQCRSAIGVRAVPSDELSIAGPLLSAEGLYILVTHSGITLAPALGRLVADCIENNETPHQLLPFSFDRFG